MLTQRKEFKTRRSICNRQFYPYQSLWKAKSSNRLRIFGWLELSSCFFSWHFCLVLNAIISLPGYTSGSFAGKFVIILIWLNFSEWTLQENWCLLFIVARTTDKSFLTFEIARGYREWLKESRWIIEEFSLSSPPSCTFLHLFKN